MKKKVILLTNDKLGNGAPELGETLLETFFVLLKQEDELPAAVFCLNRGVFALTESSLASLHLKELNDAGVPVLACKTCIEFYDLGDKLVAGEISTMKAFVNLAAEHEVLTIG
ncbi:transcriptional regulator [Gorillibacterium massiliense]|uniref:transcriptional regulator n=1 Tax=Gorillibacterium massiliense TaxID=1280390 RepID=UPI0004B35331|nr:transcriptional regulator [Gorillibacterium massiliense]